MRPKRSRLSSAGSASISTSVPNGSRRISTPLCLGGVALVLVSLRRVELDEADAALVLEDDRVAIEDPSNGCGGRGARVHSAAGKREDEQRGEEESPQTHVHKSGIRPRRRQVAVSAYS